jgi:Arc/MetJ-type ribon-helix-helix transcriptional regulator
MARKKKNKTKLHISIDSGLAKWLEEQTDKGIFGNKSHGIELALREYRKKLQEESNNT